MLMFKCWWCNQHLNIRVDQYMNGWYWTLPCNNDLKQLINLQIVSESLRGGIWTSNICQHLSKYLSIFVQIFVLLYEVMYLHLQYTLSLLTSRDLTLPFYGTFVTINILQKNCCYLSRLSKTFVCTGCPKKVTLLLCHYMMSLCSLLSLL